jgi:NAD(P)-dependent dehydrogenase (short-subunit alcohol dehydrogenase family)
MSKVIVVTGAGRGLGTDIAREALAAGHQVVATGRRPEEVEKTLGGPQDNLLVIKLDVTSSADAEAATQAAVDRFGRIDVLINNAGNFFCATTSSRTTSTPPSSNPATSAPNSSWTAPPPGRHCPSTTTPHAPPRRSRA